MTCELILGGARSGKSREAERRAAGSGLEVTVIATAEALDEEMAARIRRHQADRPAGWRTVETPLALADALRREAAPERCLIVDCLTLWLSNLLADAHTLPAGATAEDLPLLPPRARRAAGRAADAARPHRPRRQRGRPRPGAGDAARAAVPRRGRTAQPDGGERYAAGGLRRRRPAAGAEGRLNFGAKHTFRERAVGLPAPKHKMTLEDFLAWEAEQPERWEFFNGEAFMMAGRTSTTRSASTRLSPCARPCVARAATSSCPTSACAWPNRTTFPPRRLRHRDRRRPRPPPGQGRPGPHRRGAVALDRGL